MTATEPAATVLVLHGGSSSCRISYDVVAGAGLGKKSGDGSAVVFCVVVAWWV